MKSLDPLAMRTLDYLSELSRSSAQVSMYIQVTNIHQPGQDYAPVAVQFPALDDTVTELPDALRH